MNLEKKTLGEIISKEYELNGIRLPEKTGKGIVVEIVKRLFQIIEDKKINDPEQFIAKFLELQRLGKQDKLRSPMDLVYNFNKYLEERTGKPKLAI